MLVVDCVAIQASSRETVFAPRDGFRSNYLYSTTGLMMDGVCSRCLRPLLLTGFAFFFFFFFHPKNDRACHDCVTLRAVPFNPRWRVEP